MYLIYCKIKDLELKRCKSNSSKIKVWDIETWKNRGKNSGYVMVDQVLKNI